MYPDIGPCTICGDPKSERHHKDGNTLNNDPGNIQIVCRKCHAEIDGRLIRWAEQARRRIKETTEAAARARRARTHCKRGHPLSGDNLIPTKNGRRRCRACERLLERERSGK